MSSAGPGEEEGERLNQNETVVSSEDFCKDSTVSPPENIAVLELEASEASDTEAKAPVVPPKKNENSATTHDENQTGPLFMNRFSNWGQQAKDTAVATLFRRSNSSPSDVPAKISSSVQPVQAASHSSPVAKQDSSTELPSPFFAKTTQETNVIEIVEEDDHDDTGTKGDAKNSSSTHSLFTDDSRRRGVTALQWAASNVLDSVQQTGYFRGRYNREGSNTSSGTNHESTPRTEPASAKPSQMARIMSSPHASHMQALMGKDRPPNEFVMLLGRGMLGVNLKQTYLKHQGVYVDYLVHGGSAERSGVIYVGDALLSVGSVDVRKSNIWKVPQTIASAARPVHLILSTCGISSEVQMDRITYLDACLGLLYHYRILDSALLETSPEVGESTSTESDDASNESGRQSSNYEQDDNRPDPNDKMELISPTSFDGPYVNKSEDNIPQDIDEVKVDLLDSIDQFLNPGIPSEILRTSILPHVAKRYNEVHYEDIQNDLTQLAADSASFRAALRNAFLVCVVDCRRFPFLARHFSQIRVFDKVADTATTSDREKHDAFSISDAMLKLFSDMLNYSFLFSLSSKSRRKEIADHISYKYFLPSKVGNSELVPPTFDFHHIVSDKTLRALESALREPKLLTNDTFMEFQRAVAESLSLETPFLSFLVSNECARMRAYLRNTAPFIRIPFDRVVKAVSSGEAHGSPEERCFSKNFVLYVLIYLLTLTDQESFGENDDLFEQNNAANVKKGGETTVARPKRIDDSAMILCAYLFLQSSVLPLIHRYLKDPSTGSQDLKRALGHLWEVFLAPVVDDDRNGEHFLKFATCLSDLSSSTGPDAILPLTEDTLDAVQKLADELLHDYAEQHHSKFQAHKFHEWVCEELIQSEIQGGDSCGLTSLTLPSGCIKRLLRKVQWPNGITPHKPSLHPPTDEKVSDSTDSPSNLIVHNAECAIVFGTKGGSDSDQVKRFSCESLVENACGFLQPAEILPTLEAYATASPDRRKPFQGYSEESASCYQIPGWDVSLVNFMVPRVDVSSEDGESSLYGVSLVFRNQKPSQQTESHSWKVPLSEDDSSALQKALEVIDGASLFKQKFAGLTTTEVSKSDTSEGSETLIGLALVSQRNVIPAMRSTLSSLVRSFCSSQINTDESMPRLVDILRNFENHESEENILSGILQPFLSFSSAPWTSLPCNAQKEAFTQISGNHLIDSLPPIPLALLFVAALLEQKIVLSSSRRSILLSASTAMSELLKPLKWCHLFVPRVPTALASDLLQYPAPFIIGIPSEDPGMLDLIRDLPGDVTLVDLDVGRVILASSLSNNEEVGRTNFENKEDMTRALRLQILHLAQTLGSVIGRSLQPDLWLSDSVLQLDSDDSNASRFDKLSQMCHSFVSELVAGVSSCCFWIEESSSQESSEKIEPTIVLDENRFFKVKEMRYSGVNPRLFQQESDSKSKHFALSVKDFDLILELFLRCQSMNEYIGKRQRNEMAFSF